MNNKQWQPTHIRQQQEAEDSKKKDFHETFPHVKTNIIDKLEEMLPNEVPSLDFTEREVWAAVGVQSVISFLKSISIKQESQE